MPASKRVVLATHGMLGDIHPYLALALELRRRGHRPVIATSEFYRRKIEEQGIAFHAIRPDFSFDDRELHERLTEPKRGFERIIREFILPRLRETYDDLLAAVEAEAGADLLVSQILIFAAPLVAEPVRAAAALRELLDAPAIRDRAADAGRQVRAEDGVRNACDAMAIR